MLSIETVDRIKQLLQKYHGEQSFYPLHIPVFDQLEKAAMIDCIESTFVSSVGKEIDFIEQKLVAITGAKYAVAVVNGTAALQVALRLAGVRENDEVITQPLSFVATANAIAYTGAQPVFIDVDRETMGMSAQSLKQFLSEQTKVVDGELINTNTGRRISACVPMHTFGFPCEIVEISTLCKQYNLALVEDSAEAIGSYLGDQHLGTFGDVGVLSFNGNKVITAGGGGAIITNDEALAKKAKYLTTTAKVPHKWEYVHDELGYNYRMPNLNASLLKAQLEKLDRFIEEKRDLALDYANLFASLNIDFITEKEGSKVNYWLNTILLRDKEERNEFLSLTNENGIMTRPAWTLLNQLPMYKHCETKSISNAEWLADRIVNIPSSPKYS